MRPVEPSPDGVRLTLYVQPRASRTVLAGLHGDALKIRVAAPPVDGAANLELVRFLARLFGVGRSSVELTAGIGARRKTVVVRGLTVQAVERKLGMAP
jgi:uncharacterized protein (TIGR00251 family)